MQIDIMVEKGHLRKIMALKRDTTNVIICNSGNTSMLSLTASHQFYKHVHTSERRTPKKRFTFVFYVCTAVSFNTEHGLFLRCYNFTFERKFEHLSSN